VTLTFPETRATPAGEAEPGPTVSSRLLAVLGCFDLTRQLLTLTEIADSTGLPLSTARRLIVELVKWGALERLADGRYRVGTRLWRVGNLAAVQRELREAAAPSLQELSTVSAGTAQLAVLDGLDALCIDKVCGPGAVPTETHVGGRLPLHATAVGKVLLAGSPPTLLADLARRGLERRTPRTLVEPGRLAASVRRARTSGVGTSQEEMTIGAASVAAAIPARDGSTAAAIGLVVHAHRPLLPLVRAVTAAAEQVSRRLRDGGFAAGA
jgi:DNA-binding IclR family transcriptional regulator